MDERIPSRRSSTSSRSRTSQAGSIRHSNPNVFSDQYALESLQISDGFRPHEPDNNTHNPAAQEAPPPTPANAYVDAQFQGGHDNESIPIRRSSGSRKSSYNERRASLLSRSNGSRQFPPQGTRASALLSETPTSAVFRSASRASTFTIPRTQSPYQGATGPSHPYGMYPQDIGILRTPSTATASTGRPRERSYTGPSGPAQPYGMYPQNTVPEDEIGPAQSLQPPLPVGFPGRSHDYRRRLGSDAEDAYDYIGPDGYAEQLPPYTRYPDGIPPKGGGPGPASILSAEREQQGTSEETLAYPSQTRESLPQHTERTHSSAELTAVAGDGSPREDEGGNFKERVKEKGKKRVCFGRVPLWVIAILVVLMVAVLAGVIGAVVGHARGEQQAASMPPPNQHPPSPEAQSSTVVVTTTSLVDATPLPSTPTNLPSLPTGSFYVPLRSPTIFNNSCLSSYTSAWGCANGVDLKLDLSIPETVSVSPRYPPTANQIRLGPQPPQLDQSVPLMLMGDKDGMDKGPAWFFQQTYTKIVVVPEKYWGVNGQETRRWFGLRRRRKNSRGLDLRYYDSPRGIASPATKPWFCYWNNTILEGFIYVTQNSSGEGQPTSSDYDMPSNPTGDFDSPVAASSQYGAAPFVAFTSLSLPHPAIPTGFVGRRQAPDPSQLEVYPKDVKVEERRDPNTDVQPYCVHMQIMNDWTAQRLPEEPVVSLTENEPDDDQAVAQITQNKEKRGNSWGGNSATSACECEWPSDKTPPGCELSSSPHHGLQRQGDHANIAPAYTVVDIHNRG
ncbi:MAG: hypothetical protein Q9225_006137 [Loekoesia sp. 1 TL-2023]